MEGSRVREVFLRGQRKEARGKSERRDRYQPDEVGRTLRGRGRPGRSLVSPAAGFCSARPTRSELRRGKERDANQ